MVINTLYKKSIIFIIGFLFFIPICKAQHPDYAKYLLEQKDFARAKESIDSFVVTNEISVEGWLLKARIYNSISKAPELKYLVADGRMDAFVALQKAVQLNSSYVNEQLKPDNYSLALDLYNGYTHEGLVYFNAAAERNDKNSYNQALVKFKKAGLVSKYIYTNGWRFLALDTNNIYYCCKSSIYAENELDAIFYSKIIVDNNLLKNTLGNSFEFAYSWLVYYYKQQKDADHFIKYNEIGRQQFPSSIYFPLIYTDWLRQQKDYINLFASYQVLFKMQPDSSTYQITYLNDVFNYLYQSGLLITNRSYYETILTKGLTKYLKANPAATDARLLLAKMYINQANDIAREMTMRSTINVKILNGYKNTQKNLLLKSNYHLKEIVNRYSNTQVYKETIELLINNCRQLNRMQEVRKYKAML